MRLALLSILIVPFLAYSQPSISNGITTITPFMEADKAIGFKVSSGGKEIASIYFGSLNNIRAGKVKQEGDTLTFSDFVSDATPSFGKNSFISLKLYPNDPYPEISFRLELANFSPQKWESTIGKVPFHFLVCPLEGAELFHQRGWLIATPVIDPYPLLEAKGPGKHIASNWSDNWTYAPPIGAYPIPVVGLWKPSSSLYVGYEFQEARLTDNSEKNIASAYCWQLKDRGQFFALVYPYAENAYRDLRYPKNGDVISTHFRLIFSLDMPSDSDPNFFVHNYIWQRYSELLPSAPTNNDFGWLPQNYRLNNFPIPSFGGLYGVVGEGNPFQKQGNISAWGVDYASPVIDYIYEHQDQKAISLLREQLDFLMKNAEKLKIDGDDCVFWRKPIKGDWHDSYGKGVPTLHNVQAWQVALAFLDAYRNEKNPAYLPYIDGALRYTKHILYTRNCYDDVPTAQFAWDAAPVTTFCLRYYYTFRNDPERASLAQEAYKLARVMLYKYLPIFISDNDKADDIDATFFMEPNAGFPWLGEACANEIWAVAFGLAQTYVATGDPILGHYLRGMTEKWHILFRDEYYPSIRQYDGAFAEMYGLFDGCLIGKGKRSTFGGLWGGFELLSYPLGNAKARILCGEKALLTFNKDKQEIDAKDYRYQNGNFSFGLVSTSDSPFDIVVTFPFFDLRQKPVFLIRQNQKTQLTAGTDYETYPQRPDSLYIRNLQNGDIIAIGEYNPSLPIIDCQIIKPRTLEPPREKDFQIIDLAPFCNASLPKNWEDPSSFAGLIPGAKTIYQIPFFLVDPYLNQNKDIVRNASIPINKSATYAFLLLANIKANSKLTLKYSNSEETVSLRDAIPVIYGWPPLFEWKVELLQVKLKDEFREIRADNLDILAITLTNLDEKSLAPIFELLQKARSVAEEKRRSQEKLASLKIEEKLAPLKGHLAVLPQPNPTYGNLVSLMRKAKAMVLIDMPSPQQVLDPSYFNPQKIWCLFYLDGETYYQNIGGAENGDRAILDYLKQGGLIVFLPSQPLPFYYNENGKAVNSASKFGLTIGHSWESPPKDAKLFFQLNRKQNIITSLPSRFPWMKDVDQRWRGVVKPSTPGVNYIPILTLKDDKGREYGEGIAYIEYTQGELKGARLLYVWCSLLDKEEYLFPILKDVIAYISKLPPPPSSYILYRAPFPPNIDGDISDPAWRYAETIDGFHLLGSYAKPTYSTKAKMLWDDENLYIAFECQDEDIWATMKEKDSPLWEEEVVEAYIDPSGTGKNYKEFEVNPLGTLIDLNIVEPKNGNPGDWRELRKWNAEGVRIGVKVNGTLDNRNDKDNGWTVEMAIPLKNFLPYKPTLGSQWRIQLFRIDRSNTLPKPEFSSWSPTDTFHNPARFGKVIFASSLTNPVFSPNVPLYRVWRSAAGEWSVEDGILIGKNGVGDGWIGEGIHYGLKDWNDYSFSLEFKVISRGTDWRDGPWFAFRYTDASNSYSLNFSDKNIQLHKASQGITTGDDNPLVSVPWSLDSNWHKLSVELKGNNIKVILDGREIINFTDNNYNATPFLKSGEIVLVPRRWSGSKGDTIVAYRNFSLTLKD
ncbi:DUF1080 domain-containing protein [bacterium]|nr:DUF1080 domain-containing protein [bacterium]